MNADEGTPALIARGVKKSFRRESGETVTALNRVSLTVEHGALTALVGPDGAGKTTLIRLAAGLMRADEGEVRVLGIDVSADPQQVQERIGYMPQRFGLYEDLTVQENLDLYADLHGVSSDQRRERYPRLMEMTGLGEFTDRLAGKLSGGMKQKLGLACTLVRSPELLLLDEPTVGVDPLSRRELWEIILQLVNERGLTVLVSTSYLDEAERCGRVVVLHEGNVLAEGQPSDVSILAQGQTFLAHPPAGQRARALQTRLLDEPYIVDAVPEGGKVRFVTKGDSQGEGETGRQGIAPLAGSTVVPAEPRFEDGFMVLLRRTVGETRRQGEKETRRHEIRQGEGELRRQGDKETRNRGKQVAPPLQVSKSPRPRTCLQISLSPSLQVSPRLPLCSKRRSSWCVTWCGSLAASRRWIT